MSLSSKISCIFLLFLPACFDVPRDPVRKYNDDFLSKNSLKIARAKNRHKQIAQKHGIIYDKDKERALVGDDFYNQKVSAKKRNYFVLEGKKNIDDFVRNNIKYLGKDLSIYHVESKLKGNNVVDEDNENLPTFYLVENYDSYKQDKRAQEEIKLNEERLYGSWGARKEKAYNRIEGKEILVSFDYINLLSRIRTEVYLNEREQSQSSGSTSSRIGETIKDKIFNLFRGK
jgi:hypothetical protein